ncbi:MAG: DEAD/DEAH box helicase [Polyangiaceae bacterium]|nr:DEAD/DEAH box helicase [Polyangiaceae bacterium]
MEELLTLLGPELAAAFAEKGYTSLTAVQAAVLAPEARGRDLRMSSQTGSGKTVALGLAIREVLAAGEGLRALVIEPTRELAKQVEEELGWLFRRAGVRVASVTGGASYRTEHRALAARPAIVVGTPGRLLDHLGRGTLDAGTAGAVVLDEADRLLDMGFREDLESILAFTPAERRTHLVSATFPREVQALADSVQKEPLHVEGTRLGVAHTDIEHLLHLVEPRDRLPALVNLLLSEPDGQTLVFARTRADVAELTEALLEAGFTVRSLSGEMAQGERERALAAFKRGELHALVATDVAARGIDVQDVARVIQMEPPSDADTYTHRSGRTGRAGRKGESIVLVTPVALRRVRLVLERAHVTPRFAPVPTAEAIRAAALERAVAALTAEPAEGPARVAPETAALAARLAASGDIVRVLERLLERTRWSGPATPRHVRFIAPPEAPRPRTERPRRDAGERVWVPFRVSWGREHGADPRRLLAMLCRRGGIVSADVGSIRIGSHASQIEIAADVADGFAELAWRPDPRNSRVSIRREGAAAQPPRGERPRVSAHEAPTPTADVAPPARPSRPRRPPAEAEAPSAPAPARPSRPRRTEAEPSAPAHARPSRPRPAPAERPRPSRPRYAREVPERPRASPRPPAPAVERPRASRPRHASTDAGETRPTRPRSLHGPGASRNEGAPERPARRPGPPPARGRDWPPRRPR